MTVPWNDKEWDEALADGKETYWWVYYDKRKPQRVLKVYTPALAKLVSERTGWRIEPVFERI